MAHGSFTNRANNDGDLSSDPGFIPDGAFGMRVGPVSVGLAVTTVSGLEADWDYVDTPGGPAASSCSGRRWASRIRWRERDRWPPLSSSPERPARPQLH